MKAFSLRDEEQAAQLFQVRLFALHLSTFHMLPLTTAFCYIGFIPQLNIGFSSPPFTLHRSKARNYSSKPWPWNQTTISAPPRNFFLRHYDFLASQHRALRYAELVAVMHTAPELHRKVRLSLILCCIILMIATHPHGCLAASAILFERLTNAQVLSEVDEVRERTTHGSAEDVHADHSAAAMQVQQGLARDAASGGSCERIEGEIEAGNGGDLDGLGKRLFNIGLSDDAAVLADMSVKLRRAGVLTLEDLKGLSRDETKEVVKDLNLNPLQFNKLFRHVSDV
jgi:hypothetical protein